MILEKLMSGRLNDAWFREYDKYAIILIDVDNLDKEKSKDYNVLINR